MEDEKYLLDKGWNTLWSDDNWVHYGIMRGANVDNCGVDLKTALKIQKSIDNGTYDK